LIMSSSTETENPINWIEAAISSGRIKYYDYNYFSNIQEIGSGNFGKVYRANWKNSDQYFALKYFFNLDKATIKELSHEVIAKYNKHFILLKKNNLQSFFFVY